MPAAGVLFPLLIIAAWLATLGMQKGWQATFGALLQQIAEGIRALPSIPIPRHRLGFGGVADAIVRADQSVYNWFGDLLQHTEPIVAQMFRYFAEVFEKPARQVALAVADTAHTLTMLRQFVIPAMIAAKVAWIPRHLAALEADVARLLHRAPVHITKDITNYAKGAFTTVVHTAVSVPWPRIRAAERDIAALRKRVGKLAHRVPVALTAAALTAIVARTSFRWVRCSKVGKFNKGVCGMNQDYLDDFLLGALVIAGSINLRDEARAMQAVMEPAVSFTRAFVKEL